jgi:hypothetical protein
MLVCLERDNNQSHQLNMRPKSSITLNDYEYLMMARLYDFLAAFKEDLRDKNVVYASSKNHRLCLAFDKAGDKTFALNLNYDQFMLISRLWNQLPGIIIERICTDPSKSIRLEVSSVRATIKKLLTKGGIAAPYSFAHTGQIGESINSPNFAPFKAAR